MDEVLAATLRTAVGDRLDLVERLVADADEPSLASVAETELVRLTAALRAVLDGHAPDENGKCRGCSWWRGRRNRCTAWALAYEHLIAVDTCVPSGGGGRHAALAAGTVAPAA